MEIDEYQKPTRRNPVAKNSHKFNKHRVEPNRKKKYNRNPKHKGDYYGTEET